MARGVTNSLDDLMVVLVCPEFHRLGRDHNRRTTTMCCIRGGGHDEFKPLGFGRRPRVAHVPHFEVKLLEEDRRDRVAVVFLSDASKDGVPACFVRHAVDVFGDVAGSGVGLDAFFRQVPYPHGRPRVAGGAGARE